MQRSSRHKTIIRLLSSTPVSVHSLAKVTGASAITIRRDLADLEGHGLLRRVHGGAVSVNLRGAPMPYVLRASENAEGKEVIARTVAGLIADDSALVIDNGSTMVAVAQALHGKSVTALCLSLRSAFVLGDSRRATVMTPGGTVAAESLRYDGGSCLAALAQFRADIAVVGACSAMPAHGLTVTTHEDAQVKRAILASTARVILAVTGDKLSRTSSFRFGEFADVDDVVTTSDAPGSVMDEFRLAGAEVHIAV